MIEALLKTKMSQENPFYDKWEDIVETVALAYNLSFEERRELKGSKIAKLIAALPFVADCEGSRITAEINLTTYLLTKRTTNIFDCTPADNVERYRRLSMINNFIGGDKDILEKGISLLLLAMLCEYNRTAQDDFDAEKYNPIVAGDINFEQERDFLISKIERLESSHLDEIMTIFEAQILWW